MRTCSTDGCHDCPRCRLLSVLDVDGPQPISESELVAVLGEPTWRYPSGPEWDLHPHPWGGRVALEGGVATYTYDQGGSL